MSLMESMETAGKVSKYSFFAMAIPLAINNALSVAYDLLEVM